MTGYFQIAGMWPKAQERLYVLRNSKEKSFMIHLIRRYPIPDNPGENVLDILSDKLSGVIEGRADSRWGKAGGKPRRSEDLSLLF
jgi:hypothetical protein